MNFAPVQHALSRKMAIPAVAVAGALAFGAWSLANPAHAANTPAQEPLASNSVAPLLTLDQAMENLASHVTPAIVNITVTSKSSPQQIDEQNSADGEGQEQQGQGG